MKPVLAAAAAAGVAVLASLILAGGSRLAEEAPTVEVEAIDPDDPALATEAIPDSAAAARPSAPTRAVAPGIARPEVDGPLERVAPRAPLGDLALARAPEPGVPEPTLLYQPVAVAAGRIEAQGHVIALQGIEAVEPERECQGESGAWPCGMVARTAFRNWLRGRAVECTVSDIPADEPVVSACSLGDDDMAAWLVSNGFAEAVAGGPYEEAGAKAEAEGRGIFGDGR